MELLSEEQMRYIEQLVERYPTLETIKKNIIEAYHAMESCYQYGGKLLIAGNGGSAADAEHIVGELMKSFRKPRPIKRELADKLHSCYKEKGEKLGKRLESPLTAIALTDQNALTTAYANDVDWELAVAQQLLGVGRKGDVFLAISTSGNSSNMEYAAMTAQAMGIKVIELTGSDGGRLAHYADITVKTPEKETYRVQEYHIPIYHCWCLMLEEKFF